MDGAVYRYGFPRKARDIAVCAVLAVAAQIGVEMFHPFAGVDARLAVSGLLLLASVFTVVRWRWGRWASADDKGVSSGSGPDDPGVRLGWAELEELTVDASGLMAKGGGVEVLASADLDGISTLRDQVFRRAGPALYRRLRDRLTAGESLEFPGVEERSEALWKSAAWNILFGAPLVAGLGYLHWTVGVGAAACLAALTFGRAGNRSMIVTLDRHGLRTRAFSLPWGDLKAARLFDDGRLWIEDVRSRSLLLHPNRPNFIILQQLILERVAGR